VIDMYEMKLDLDKLYNSSTLIRQSHSITEYMKQNGYYLGVKNVGSNEFIKCPFHTDLYPSFSINDKRGLWHCFSCGRGGDYIKLLQFVQELIYGTKISYSKIVDTIIKSDDLLKQQLGYNSIYTRELEVVSDNFSLQRFKWDSSVKIAETFITLSSKMIDGNKSAFSFIALAQELMFQESDPMEIWTILRESTLTDVDSVQSLDSVEDILRGIL